MINRLFIPTSPWFCDMLTSLVTNENCQAVLFNPEDEKYSLNNGILYYKGSTLSEEDVFELVSDPNTNKVIDENVLIYGIFSFLYATQDLRNDNEFEISVYELSKYLGINTGSKGFMLTEKLINLSKVYGIINGLGVFPLLEIKEQQQVLIIKSDYLHKCLNLMICKSREQYGEKAKYYTDKVYASIVAVKNKTAALIVIELAKLISKSRGKSAHISIENLVFRIPKLINIFLTENTTSFKNKYLKRAFTSVHGILEDKTEFFIELKDLTVLIPSVSVSKLNSVINISFSSYHKI